MRVIGTDLAKPGSDRTVAMRIYVVAGTKKILLLEDTTVGYVPLKPMCDVCLGPVDSFETMLIGGNSLMHSGYVEYTARCHGQQEVVRLNSADLVGVRDLVIGPCFRVRDPGGEDGARHMHRALLESIFGRPTPYYDDREAYRAERRALPAPGLPSGEEP